MMMYRMGTRPSLLRDFIPDEKIKILYYHACRTDIPDNNDKADMIQEVLGYEFHELGAGTNRIAFLHNGVVIKVAYDRRGFIDNRTEFKRANAKPYLAKTYESNMLINVAEYITIMDHQQFMENEAGIKEILTDLSEDFIFNDLGFDAKNCYNWGYRETRDEDDGSESGELCIADYGYLYPKVGQEEALRCPHCKQMLDYNSTFTRFRCPHCNGGYSIMDIQRRMKTFLEDFENEQLNGLVHARLPRGVFPPRR